MHPTFRARTGPIAALMFGSALLIAACGGGATTTTGPLVTSPGSTTAATGAASGGIAATESDFKIELSAASAAAGPVTFNVTNSGAQTHEFVVVKTETMGDALVTKDSGAAVDEDASGFMVVDELEDLEVGATKDLAVTLEAGHYVLICNLPTHYTSGMHADFTVGS